MRKKISSEALGFHKRSNMTLTSGRGCGKICKQKHDRHTFQFNWPCASRFRFNYINMRFGKCVAFSVYHFALWLFAHISSLWGLMVISMKICCACICWNLPSWNSFRKFPESIKNWEKRQQQASCCLINSREKYILPQKLCCEWNHVMPSGGQKNSALPQKNGSTWTISGLIAKGSRGTFATWEGGNAQGRQHQTANDQPCWARFGRLFTVRRRRQIHAAILTG